jgi:cytochrome P450
MQVDLLSAELIANPFPFYEEARRQGPVVRNDTLGFWMITDHAEAMTVLRDPVRFSSSPMGAALGVVGATMAASSMASADPPEHARLRGVVQRAFIPRAIALLEPMMANLVDGTLRSLGRGEVLDAVNDLSYPLSISVIAELLGVSAADRDAFKEWSDDLLLGGRMNPSGHEKEAAEKGAAALADYFREQIEDRRRHPTDRDLVGRLVAANENASMSDDELLASCILLLFAGNETTTKLIGNSILCLAQHPLQRQCVAEEPTLLNGAVEELVRFMGPPQAEFRLALEDVALGEAKICAGELMMVLLGCANRDPKHFPNPDQFDVTRSPNDHIGFSHGIHFCLGASLARLETRVVLSRLLGDYPTYRLARPDEPPRYADSFFMRGLTGLEIVA